ncbi:MAG: hypothetical protein P8Z38_01260 [Robiginitalea sp.]
MHEALHLSDRERQILMDCLEKIRYELERGIDMHSKGVIVSNIELFLNHCNRFCARQFITRDTANYRVANQFEGSLNDCLRSEKAALTGCPMVSCFAEEQHLSPNYFGDLVKKETGRSAHEHIQSKLITVARERFLTRTNQLMRLPMNWASNTRNISAGSSNKG